tara:strand:+ start:461 stop:646 length:186 start_codon:yes stop_codon:yes gene_type:complete
MDITLIEEFFRKHEERNLAMIEASIILGFDISFSKDEIIREVEQEVLKHIEQESIRWLLYG